MIIVPEKDSILSIPSKEPRFISGEIVSIEKTSRLDGPIIHRPGVIIAPLFKGVPAKLYLKRYSNQDGYYLIGNFSPDMK